MHRTFSTKKVPWSYQRVCIVRGTAERAKAGARTMATDGKNFDPLIGCSLKKTTSSHFCAYSEIAILYGISHS